jgi:starvation-inducible outer membrane lipoprotein
LRKHIKAASPQPNPTESDNAHIGGMMVRGITQKDPTMNNIPNINPKITARPARMKRAKIRSIAGFLIKINY